MKTTITIPVRITVELGEEKEPGQLLAKAIGAKTERQRKMKSRPFTEEDLDFIRKASADGKKAKEISEALGRSKISIYTKLKRMGL